MSLKKTMGRLFSPEWHGICSRKVSTEKFFSISSETQSRALRSSSKFNKKPPEKAGEVV